MSQQHIKCTSFRRSLVIDRNKKKAQRQMMRVSLLQILPYDKTNQIFKTNQGTFTSTLKSTLKCKKVYDNMTRSLINNTTLYSNHYHRDKKLDKPQSKMQPITEREIVKMNSLNYRAEIMEVINKIKNKKCLKKQSDIQSNKIDRKQFKLANYCRSNLLELRSHNRFKRWESISTNFSQLDKINPKIKQKQLKLSTQRTKNNSLEQVVNKIDELKGWQQPSIRFTTLYQHYQY